MVSVKQRIEDLSIEISKQSDNAVEMTIRDEKGLVKKIAHLPNREALVLADLIRALAGGGRGE